jgi:protein-glucosylgalactosylhydroxylysine glucosidase
MATGVPGALGERRGPVVIVPISPPPLTQWRPDFLPAYLSNGLIGLRVGHVPLFYGVAMLSGFEGLDPETRVEAFARVPYPLAGDIRIGGAALSDPGRAVLREQRYDFSCGELHTWLAFEADDIRADIEILTFCSRTQPSLVLQEVSLTVDRDCEVTMSAIVDARDVPGDWAHNRPGAMDTRPEWEHGPFCWISMGALGKCGMAGGAELLGADQVDSSFHLSTERLIRNFTFPATRGRPYRLRRGVSLVSSHFHSQPHMQAARLAKAGMQRGFDALRQDNRISWQWLWQGRVVLAGAPTRWQAFADAAYFYLQTSVHGASPSSTSVFGLAYWPNYHYYRGHMLWDLETFALPPLTLTHPNAALGLLRYRGSRLPAARANAALNGHRGAQYPWESSLTHGHEAAPVDSHGPYTEHHISSDVAIAFARYVHATADLQFARYEALPVLSDVADWIESRVEQTDRGYEIRQATGIAEAGTTVDNSAFVNMAAAIALRETITMAKELDRPYRECWEGIAENMVIPLDPQTGVIQNHDGYRPDEPKGDTPEAPAGLFPLEFPVDADTERATLQFYLRLADQYAGEPMLSALLGLYGARVGDRAASMQLFEKGYANFIIEPYTITTEYSPTIYPDQPPAGPFTANLAGFLTSCLYGLTGLRLHGGDPTSWFEREIVMPEGWDGIHVDRIFVHGRPMTMDAFHGDKRGRLTDPNAARGRP